MRPRAAVVTTALTLLAVTLPLGAARATGAQFLVGAAVGDMTPPAFDAANHTPPIDPPGLDGPRGWDFMEPYGDQNGNGTWDPGEPYADLNHNARYDGIYLGGGGGRDPKPPTQVADPITARAFVVDNGSKRIAVEVLDTIGTFTEDMDRIRVTFCDTHSVGSMFCLEHHISLAPEHLPRQRPDRIVVLDKQNRLPRTRV